MVFVTPLRFEQARRAVLDAVSAQRSVPSTETVALADCSGRVLSADVVADRDYPPLPRSVRDGFALRAADTPGTVQVVGEVRAGERLSRSVCTGEAAEIMTGAPVPHGADSVVMIEHVVRSGDNVAVNRPSAPGNFIVPAGSECANGSVVVPHGTRLDFAHIAALASVGAAHVEVFRTPNVAIIATGDELVEVDAQPLPHQIRNSNSLMLAAQVERAGGAPHVLPVAEDQYESTRAAIELALGCDLLLLSGGVSAGKYDLVETVLADFSAEFIFNRVLIQPGQPVVFGRVRERFFFGLPGNPASTAVTFEIFARAALDLLGGVSHTQFPVVYAKLRQPFRHKPGLTRFLPAELEPEGGWVKPVGWQGSGDVFAVARANAFLVARDQRESWAEGDFIEVIRR